MASDDDSLINNLTPEFSKEFSSNFATATASANASIADAIIYRMVHYLKNPDKRSTVEKIRDESLQYREKHIAKQLSFDEYLQRYCLKSNLNMVFRGQFNTAWDLTPSFHRLDKKYRLEDYSKYTRILKGLCRTFSINEGLDIPNESKELTSENLKKYLNHFSWLQHHGYKTILLDWTKSPTAALFFSLDHYLREEVSKWDGKVRIFIINQKQLEEALETSLPFSILGGYGLLENDYFFKLFEASATTAKIYYQNAFHSVSYFEDHLIPIYYLESKKPGIFEDYIVEITNIKEALRYLKSINNTPVSLYGSTEHSVIEKTAMIEYYSE